MAINSPILKGLGITDAQIRNQITAKASVLYGWRDQVVTKDTAAKIFALMCERGSLENCGGYQGIAAQTGCTYHQAVSIVEEIISDIDQVRAGG